MTDLQHDSERLQHLTTQLQQAQAELAWTRRRLTEEQQRHQLLLDMMPDAYLVTDRSGQIQMMNQAAETLLGVNLDTLSDLSGVPCIAVNDQKRLQTWLDAIASPSADSPPPNGRPAQIPQTMPIVQDQAMTLQSKDGQTIPAQVSVWVQGDRSDPSAPGVQLYWRIQPRQSTAPPSSNDANYQAILSAMPDLIIRLSADATYREVIQTNCTFAVLPCSNQFIGQSIDSVLPAALVDRHRYYLQKAVQTGELQVFEQMLRVGDRLQYEEVRVVKSGEDEGLVLVRDISDRKQAELTQQQQLAEIEAIYEGAPVGLGLLDTDLRFVRLNPKLAAMNGISVEEHLGRTLSDVVPHLAEAIEPYYHQVLATGDPILNIEVVGETAQQPGVERAWIESWFPLKDTDGRVTGINVVVQEISERRQLEMSLQASEARLNRILDNANAAIASFRLYANYDWEYEYWSAGCKRLYGYPLEAYADQTFWFSQVLPEDQETVLYPLFDDLFAERDVTVEYRFRRQDGEIRWFSSSYSSQKISDDCWIVTSVNQDITNTKTLESQFYRAQRLESLGTLASGIAHDLNNVLTPILTMAQLLEESLPQTGSDAPDMLRLLKASAQQGINMVQQILTFVSGSEGNRVSVQLETIMREVVQVVQPTIPSAIALHTQLPQTPLWLVSADPTHLTQVFVNLCVNARDAMPNGGTLTLSGQNVEIDAPFAQSHLDATAGGYVKVCVTDTGEGMSPAVRDRIFDPFFTTKPKGEGTGLGLSTALGIVRNHGGFLTVSSAPGQGTEIAVYLPATDSAAPAPSQPSC